MTVTPRDARILVVDDDPVSRKVLAQMLAKLGHASHEAANGQEAFDAVVAGTYALVLMDLRMPVLDGIEAARRITRRLGEGRPTLVAITGDPKPEDAARCLEAGMVGYHRKPLREETLAVILQSAFPVQPPSA